MSVFKDLPPAPRARKKPVTFAEHGFTRTDDYAWLRAENWQAMFEDTSLLEPEIRAHLEAENAYMKAAMADTQALQETLFAEMRGRIKEDDSSVPMPDGPFAYGWMHVTGGEYPHYFRTPREGGEKQILLDGDKEGEGRPFFNLGGLDYSPDHRLGLWSYDDKGSERYTILVRDLETYEDLPDRVENSNGNALFAADGLSFFYAVSDENYRATKVFHHVLGTQQAEDRLVYEEQDVAFGVGIAGALLNDFVFINIGNNETSEIRLIPATRPGTEPKTVSVRVVKHQYAMKSGGEVFFIRTNADGAEDFKIVTAPVDRPEQANWTEIVPHEPGRLILDFAVYRSHLVWLERRDSLPRMVVKNRQTGEEHAIAFSEEAYSLGLHGWSEYDTDVIRFTYSSMTTPHQLFDYDMVTRERRLLKTAEVPSGHDPDDYVTRRIFATAADGASVPVSLLYRKNTRLDGSAPCLLYGYGAYGISIPASFDTDALSLVDRGFVYAIAHIRGGMDRGYHWYETGRMAHKMNSFTDFIAVADHLVAEKFTAYGRIVAQGASAGGLLMGAVVNLAPEKFGAILAGVPFVDLLTTILDDTLPLTPGEWTEWGNPITSAEQYGWMAAYSPYDNIGAKPYPPILALAGLTDPRVTYWEPAKWVAKLRDHTTSDAPILLRTNMDAGHFGASGRFHRLEETALEYAFALKVMGKM